MLRIVKKRPKLMKNREFSFLAKNSANVECTTSKFKLAKLAHFKPFWTILRSNFAENQDFLIFLQF